jgi:hypothetical protein
MKLRFQGSSLRLRLSQPEVTRLKEDGLVEEPITFAPGRTLVYSIETSSKSGVSASFDNGRIRVTVPIADAHAWIDGDQVGIEHSGPPLDILIEKDFQCLHRSAEETPGAFPNPLAKGPEPAVPGDPRS